MHSVTLKPFIDFTDVESRHTSPRQTTHSFIRFNCGSPNKRNCRIVTCASECDGGAGAEAKSQSQQTSSWFFQRSQSFVLMKQQMELAAKSENYEEAARLRDSLKSFEEEEQILRLRALMKEAIANDKFAGAASDATTMGIRVQVRSEYFEGWSQPIGGQYFPAYRIRITNNSDRPVQLLKRHWIITDANEKSEDVWDIGVIGEQPLILPYKSFEYSSVCPLTTPSGRMEGDFEMKHVDQVETKTFNVAVAPFALSTFGDATDNT